MQIGGFEPESSLGQLPNFLEALIWPTRFQAKFFDDIFGKAVVKDVAFVRDTSSLLPLIEAPHWQITSIVVVETAVFEGFSGLGALLGDLANRK